MWSWRVFLRFGIFGLAVGIVEATYVFLNPNFDMLGLSKHAPLMYLGSSEQANFYNVGINLAALFFGMGLLGYCSRVVLSGMLQLSGSILPGWNEARTGSFRSRIDAVNLGVLELNADGTPTKTEF